MPQTNAPTITVATAQAQRCYQANLSALAATQSALAASLGGKSAPEVTWLLGRDGSLTAQDGEGQWIGGTSLPLIVGRSLLASLELQSPVGCFLQPTTAGEIRAALEIIGPSQAIIAVIPDEAGAIAALHCNDFSADIGAGRLWVTYGRDWPDQLAELLKSNPGLCIPGQYIRTTLLSEADLAAISSVSNSIISTETNSRVHRMATLSAQPRAEKAKSVCVVAGSNFRLWDMAAPVLAQTLLAGEPNWRRLDTDQPLSASPLALAMAAADCEAVVFADLYRADLPGTVSDEIPWITWVTKPRFGAAPSKSPRDALLLADASWRDMAISAGWPRGRIAVAGWPALFAPLTSVPAGGNGALGLVADAVVGVAPENFRGLSSLGTLWDYIAAEMAADPLAVGQDTDQYLSSRAAKLDVAAETVDRTFFTNKLLIPAWRRGIARLLIGAGLPVAVFGEGWDQAPEFAKCWGGNVASLEDLRRVASVCSAVIHPVPSGAAHPVEAMGRRVVRGAGRSKALIQQARLALAGKASPRPGGSAGLSVEAVRSVLFDSARNR